MCRAISKADFQEYKNNFVINGDTIEFYFDDLLQCPTYSVNNTVKIPIVNLKELLKPNDLFTETDQ